MSLRNSLLLLYGMILAVLVIALGGFYWAVEEALVDQNLLKVARSQLQDIEIFSSNSQRLVAETAKYVMLDHSTPAMIGRVREWADGGIQRLEEMVRKELKLLHRHERDGSDSREWLLEKGELDELLQIHGIFHEICDKSDAIIAGHKAFERDRLFAMIRDLDDVLFKRLMPRVQTLQSSEMGAMLFREKTMLDNMHLFENLAIGTCLATLVVLVTGLHFLRQALKSVARREGILAADRAKSEFLAHMSHEIRTPMTAILGFTDILLHELTDPEKIKTASIVKRNGEHLLEIINDILDLSKIEAGLFDVKRELCSPLEIVADVASLTRIKATAKGLALFVEFQGAIPEAILSSPVRVRQILINLVGNAIKFTESGCIRLVTRLVHDAGGDHQLQFDVIDTGIGMSKESMSGLFKPFTQVDTSSARKAEGTGLGLAISQHLAHLLGGDTQVTSVLGKGSKFSVTISTGPLDGVEMIERPEEPSRQVESRSDDRKRPKLHGSILLVEDSTDNQRLIGYLLKRAGAEVTIAENGLVALEKIETASQEMIARREDPSKSPFDVILMDMQMPRMDGYEVTHRLRARGYRHPIIAITAHAMSTDRQKCMEAGCDDYTTKPVKEETLLAMLAGYLEKGSRVFHKAAPSQEETGNHISPDHLEIRDMSSRHVAI